MKFKGLTAAVATPMRADGELNLDIIGQYAEFLIGRGVGGVFVNGTTGESLLLDEDERKAVAEKWMSYSDRLNILVHVGSTSYKTAMDLAAHAEKIGAKAISAMGPCFLPPSRPEELVSFNKKVAQMASETPYYYYHIPSVSGVKVDMRKFIELAVKEIPTFNGIKFTSYDTWEMLDCIKFGGGVLDILHGHDETLLSGLEMGCAGGIGTSYNVTSRLFCQMIQAFEKGDIAGATDLQYKANKIVALMCKRVNSVVGIKAMLEIFGIPVGPCRLPVRSLSAEEMKSLENELGPFMDIL
jgi:N-acetylneuraminate lyase